MPRNLIATYSLRRQAWTVYSGWRLDQPFERLSNYHRIKTDATREAILHTPVAGTTQDVIDPLSSLLSIDDTPTVAMKDIDFSALEERILAHYSEAHVERPTRSDLASIESSVTGRPKPKRKVAHKDAASNNTGFDNGRDHPGTVTVEHAGGALEVPATGAVPKRKVAPARLDALKGKFK